MPPATPATPASRPVIAVVGASRRIGHAVALALLRRGRYAVRALIHQPESARARQLRQAGATLLPIDSDDAAALQHAFSSAHGVFAITHFWRHRCPDRELAEAARIARAAAHAQVTHLVWSSSEDTRRWVRPHDPRLPTRHGRWKVPASDAKGAANQLLRDLGVPSTFLYIATPWERLLGAALGADGRLTLPTAGRLWAGIASADVGEVVAALFERGSWTIGRSIGIAGEHLDSPTIARTLAAVLQRSVPLATPCLDELRRSDIPGVEDLVAQLRFQQLFDADYRARRSVAEARSLHPGVMGLEAWLRQAGRSLFDASHGQRWAA